MLLFAGMSMSSVQPDQHQVLAYYDDGLDSLLAGLQAFGKACTGKAGSSVLKRQFLACRKHYKKISFFIEQFDTRSARLLNGPDLLRIEEDTQQDTIRPHGFQRIEAILYADRPDREALYREIDLMRATAGKLRQDPDHSYYFRDDRVWEALRSGAYRIVSMGITGFDVPLCLNAAPETEVQLRGIREVVLRYRSPIVLRDKELFDDAVAACDSAIAYCAGKTDFVSFDRLYFIRYYMNPLSQQLGKVALAMGYVNRDQRSPLNPEAAHLFAPDIFDIDFFSPNDRYRVSPERVALGKKLFYDTKLSQNGQRSCASCHKPELAFTDGLPKGRHIDGKSELLRNTPTLWNSAFQSRQFYDSRALVLETQLNAVVHSKEEMGGSLTDAIPVLDRDAWYKEAFATAYRNDKIPVSQYTIANAIASYIRTLVSFNSRFDRYIRRDSEDLSASEQKGFNLFMGKAKCGTCHYAPMFNGLVPPLYEETESEILAVPLTNARRSVLDTDEGRFRHTQVPLHRYAFKTPGLRNIALTAPYMHNGVFNTLEEVIDFYDQGGGAGRGISLETQTLPAERLQLSRNEKKELIAFLHALTDTSTRLQDY